jgi:HopA1 effector protein family
MSYHQEIDRAVMLARRAVTAANLQEPGPLTRFLYQRWYLGRTSDAVPTQGTTHGTARTSGTGTAPRFTPSTPPWRTWGAHWTDDRQCHGADLVRLFLACAPHTALHTVAAVTAHAQQWDQPWLLTSRALGQAVPSADSTVLYLPAEALGDLHEPIEAMLADIRPFLAGSVPALTLRIGRGASLAQNPADGRPFGQHRCSLVAGTVLANQGMGHGRLVDEVRETFRRAGVDPQRPYRALGSQWQWTRQPRAARSTVAA